MALTWHPWMLAEQAVACHQETNKQPPLNSSTAMRKDNLQWAAEDHLEESNKRQEPWATLLLNSIIQPNRLVVCHLAQA